MQEGISRIMLKTEEYAALRGCTVQYTRKMCETGKLEAETKTGRTGRGGKTYLIPLASLPDKEIKRYLKQRKKEEILDKAKAAPEPIIDLNYERLSAEERAELNLKNKLLDDWIVYRNERKMGGESLADADENYVRIIQLQYPDMAMSLRTIRRWDKLRREKGEISLIDTRGRHENHKTKLVQLVMDIFEYYYLDESRKTVTMCMKLTEAELKRLDRRDLLPLPTDRTFIRWITKIPEPMRIYYRFGDKACKDKCLPYIHRSYEDLYSNDIWVCDNHTFDIIIQKDEKPLRVYLTGFLDVRSRKMVGHYVTLNPSSDATLYALRRGIEQYGIPKRILADNGREFLTFDMGGRGFRKKSKAAELDPATIMDRLGIDFRTALVRNARAKIIERTFLTVKEEFSKMFDTYTGGNTQERPERLKYIEKDLSKLTVMQDFESFVEHYIEGYLNCRVHTGEGMNGMTPNQVYKKCLVEQRKAAPEELNVMLLRSTRLQKVSRYGVKLNFYGQDIYFMNEDMNINHFGEQVYVRYNPSDLDEVRIYDEHDRFMMTAKQDGKISYFASKEEVSEHMKEQRHYASIVKAYKKDKGIKASKPLDLIMDIAQQNMLEQEELSPDIIRIMRSPDAEFNELCIKQAVGADAPLDFAVANARIRRSRGLD